ncbi:unnamed protein product [Orchesella dallaii]
MQDRFQKNSPDFSIRKVDLEQLVTDITNETHTLLQDRVQALKLLVDWAENKAREHFERKGTGDAPVQSSPDSYVNAKKIIKGMPGEPDPILPPIVSDDEDDDRPHKKEKDPSVRRVIFKADNWFGTEVNHNFSSVHVPTSIYDLREDILDGIAWTSNMDDVFKSNFNQNPTLLWQYYASSSGFMRQYPASKWPNDNSNKHNPDIYDCRTRPWYTAAANSPKNMVIIQDVSGSMTGLRREIAKHVIYTILDTLTDNDYVSVLNFTDTTSPVVPCFKDDLVQANLENVREFKVSLDQDRTAGMANFSEALLRAFSILERHRDHSLTGSANCNEAIMLITDGAPYYFDEIFSDLNNMNISEKRGRTRVFTYLVGREVTDTNEVLWMACKNKGFFVHVTTLGEVQEQVLKYLTVMSKPMVMSQTHNISWSRVYPDVVEIAESDWLWDEKIRKKQRERSQRYKLFLKKVVNETEGNQFFAPNTDEPPKKGKKGWSNTRISGLRVAEFLDYGMTNPTEDDLREILAKEERIEKTRGYLHSKLSSSGSVANQLPTLAHHNHYHHPRAEAITQKKLHEQQKAKEAKLKNDEATRERWGPDRKFQFMVSASMPVFDQRNQTTVTKFHFNESGFSIEESVKQQIAIFLGVVGTDVPIKEFQKIASPFKLGVNGYAFAITENGYIVFHPEWRPLTQDILKPNFNSVDLAEIELVDSDESRNIDKELMDMRRSMLFIAEGVVNSSLLQVRVPQDDFRRVRVRKQQYAYAKINKTQYTLGVTVPKANMYQFHAELEIRLDAQQKNVSTFFDKPNEPRKWRLHPDWTYCEYIRGGPQKKEDKLSKEDILIQFLQKIQLAKGSWPWRNIKYGNKNTYVPTPPSEIYSCDKLLVQSLVFDAKITGTFKLKELNQSESQVQQKFGAVVAFIATRSGLTRWIDYSEGPRSDTYIPFSDTNPRAIDELWYKRAVDRYEVDQGMSFVISVPYDAGTRNDSLVTATRAIFVRKRVPEINEFRSAPAAVTGTQFEHEKLAASFIEITQTILPECTDHSVCHPCNTEYIDCYILDDNGFVVVSDTHKYTGRFFGDVDGNVLNELVNQGIYERKRVVDYQAICHHLLSRPGMANMLLNPFVTFKWMLRWALGRLAWLALQINLHNFIHPDYASVLAEVSDEQPMKDTKEDISNWHPFLELAPINKTRLRPCHKEYVLYQYGPLYYSTLFTTGFYSGVMDECDSIGNDGDYAVHLINRTNLILLVVQGTCNGKGNKERVSIKPTEVTYELEEDLENMTVHNEVVAQICRIPILTLERKKPSTKCYDYDKREDGLREECGGSAALQSSITFVLLSIFLFFNHFQIRCS